MVFSSLLFLFRFLPIVFLIYYLVPFKLKNTVLFLSSLFFYTWGEPKFFPIMLISIGVNYVAGLLMEKYDEKPKVRKICFWVTFVVTLGFLLFFKYTNFFLSNINAFVWHWAAAFGFFGIPSAAGNQLLYLPDSGVHHRCLQAQNQGGAQPDRLWRLCCTVPTADCRSYRSVFGHQQGVKEPKDYPCPD